MELNVKQQWVAQEMLKHMRLLYWKANKLVGPNIQDVEDLVQQTFLRIMESDNSLDKEFKHSIKNYAFVTMSSIVNNAFEKKRLFRSVDKGVIEDRFVSSYSETATNPEQNVIDFELIQEVNQILKKMPEHVQEAVRMNLLDGNGYREIAAKLAKPNLHGMSAGSVIARMVIAMKLLRKHFAEYHSLQQRKMG